MRGRALLAAYLAAAIGAALVAVPLARFVLPSRAGAASLFADSPSPKGASHLQLAAQIAPPLPTLRAPANPASVKAPDYLNYFGWALLDRRTNQLAGSDNRETSTNTTESMIKVWIAADYLRHMVAANKPPPAAALAELNRMIIHSDDNIASKYFKLDGGTKAISELISVCGLRGTKSDGASRWSYTTMSPADAARMGVCVAAGTAAGPTWATWLLTAMHNVTGSVADQQLKTGGGHWGIIDALPAELAAGTSIKNGWTAQVYDSNWHINCLAVHADWVLAVELHYPWTSPDGNWQHANNLQQGADACKTVTSQLLVIPDN
jgi:hypothetical protein